MREAARSAWSRSFWCSAACLEQRPDSGSAMGRRQNRWLGNDADNEAESRQWRCWWFCDSWQFLSGGAGAFHFGKSWYTSRLFSYEWQIKELGEGVTVCVARKGLKVVGFSVICGRLVRVANTGVSGP